MSLPFLKPRSRFLALGLSAGVVALSAGAAGGRVALPAGRSDSALAGQVGHAAGGLRGLSGKLRAMTYAVGHAAAMYPMALASPLGEGDSLIRLPLVPLQEKEGAFWRGYYVGFWPRELTHRRAEVPAVPRGFIAVTPENERTPVSAHFRLGDFLTHDQPAVWPKVLVLKMSLPDKLELIEMELVREGLPSRLQVMSGFRTPQYNAQGVGPLGGRAANSRHMYGEAADVFVDADRDGRMDDLNRDGRVNTADARVLAHAVEQVELRYPQLTGGLGIYSATSAHGPFVHVDVRGYRARW
jgi:Peptidase M15